MNNKLLLDIFRIPSQSTEEYAISAFITKTLRDLDVPFKQDAIGNIYNISNVNKPLLCAHMDTVQDKVDVELTDFVKIRGNVLSGYGVIGGDDKCGIYIILDLLSNYKDFNFLFTVMEEVGARGSESFIQDNELSHILYGLVLDRMGNTDIICTRNDYGVKALESYLLAIGKEFGYGLEMGTFSDADNLNKQISCANLSVGYYRPHSKNEYVILKDLETAETLVHSVIKNVKESFPAPKIIKRKSRFSYYGGGIYETYGYGNYGYNGLSRISIDDNEYFEEDKCTACGKTASTTIYSQVLEDFICVDCMELLRMEIDEFDFNIIDESTSLTSVSDGMIDSFDDEEFQVIENPPTEDGRKIVALLNKPKQEA
tara:strand:+ start:2570 stop:3682 length:1113 start_codon:yes stop_codon:yes gene_type:complete